MAPSTASVAARLGGGSLLPIALRFGRFGLVGASGLVVNTVLLAAFAELAGIHYLLAAVLATQGSSAWNLLLTERWVFYGRSHQHRALSRACMFFAVNNAALVLRAPLLVALTEGVGIGYLASNLVTLIVLVIARFALADTWIWARARQAGVTDATRDRVRELRGPGPRAPATEGSAPLPDLVRPPAAPGAALTSLRRLALAPPRLGRLHAWALPAILLLAVAVRTWHLNALGYNSDEAVYAGQGASIANFAPLEPFFPTFRAHPLLFQTLLSFGFHVGFGEVFGRLLAVGFGVGTIALVFLVGRTLYGRQVGLVAALFMAVMPYHVIVTRQVLLDGPMVFYATLLLYVVARYSQTQRRPWLLAAGAAMGLTFLSKETSILLLGSLYAFFAVTPTIRVRVRDIAGSLAVMAGVVLAFPLALSLGGRPESGGHYLAWQIFRRANHDWGFYPSTVPEAIGPLVLVAALAGLVFIRRRRSWRETLLITWIVVPAVFFQLWPVKGFQYLLPAAPALALLAAWAIGRGLGDERSRRRGPRLVAATAAITAVSLLVPTLIQIQPRKSTTFLAGSGGVPGGREAGRWIERHVPKGARLLTVGPSMANILQFYGRRKAYGVAVSPNPLHRNPAYEPLPNPDLLIRQNDLQYLVWDAFSAARSPFFSRRILRYADRFNGRLVHSETIEVQTAQGESATKPLISIYEVRP